MLIQPATLGNKKEVALPTPGLESKARVGINQLTSKLLLGSMLGFLRLGVRRGCIGHGIDLELIIHGIK